jgi:flagellar motor protein MotB
VAEDHGHDEHGGGEGGEHKAHKSHGSHGPGHGGGHEEHAGAPEWLISFADNVALLMGFFVILLAMNMGPKAKPQGNNSGQGPGGHRDERTDSEFTPEQENLIELQYGVMEGFNRKPRKDSKDAAERKLASDHEKVLEQRKRRNTPGNSDQVLGDPRKTDFAPNLTVEFDNESANLSFNSRQKIQAVVADELKGKDWMIEVRGHVSAQEAKAAANASLAADGADTTASGSGAGFELGYKRAYAVAAEMARDGIAWRRIRLVSCADTDRVVSRADIDAGANMKNQRAVIIQSKDPVPPDPNSIEPGGPGH